MVAVVQLVEHQVVILGVAGSSPVSHPKVKASSFLGWGLVSLRYARRIFSIALPGLSRKMWPKGQNVLVFGVST